MIFTDDNLKQSINPLREDGATDILYKMFYSLQVFNEKGFWSAITVNVLLDLVKQSSKDSMEDFELNANKYYRQVRDLLPSGSSFAKPADHEIFHLQGDFKRVLLAIGNELGIKGQSVIVKKLREKFKGKAKTIKTGHGSVRLEEDGIMVIVDERFKKDHAGRKLLTVYARNEAKAQHELAELRQWIKHALEKKLLTDRDIKDGFLGERLKSYFGLLRNSPKEVKKKNNPKLKFLLKNFIK